MARIPLLFPADGEVKVPALPLNLRSQTRIQAATPRRGRVFKARACFLFRAVAFALSTRGHDLAPPPAINDAPAIAVAKNPEVAARALQACNTTQALRLECPIWTEKLVINLDVAITWDVATPWGAHA